MIFVELTHNFLDKMIGNHHDRLMFELQSLPGVSRVTISIVTLFLSAGLGIIPRTDGVGSIKTRHDHNSGHGSLMQVDLVAKRLQDP